MRIIIILLLTIAITSQAFAFGAERSYRGELPVNSAGSIHLDNNGFQKRSVRNIDPLVNRAHEILDVNNFETEKCTELKEIAWKLQTMWINANYDDRKKIDEVRIATEKKCGEI